MESYRTGAFMARKGPIRRAGAMQWEDAAKAPAPFCKKTPNHPAQGRRADDRSGKSCAGLQADLDAVVGALDPRSTQSVGRLKTGGASYDQVVSSIYHERPDEFEG